MGSGCGSVGRAVAINTRGLWFDSSHWQNFIEHLFVNLFIINIIEKTKIYKKRPGMAHFLKKSNIAVPCVKIEFKYEMKERFCFFYGSCLIMMISLSSKSGSTLSDFSDSPHFSVTLVWPDLIELSLI